jgi:hypothetical protein
MRSGQRVAGNHCAHDEGSLRRSVLVVKEDVVVVVRYRVRCGGGEVKARAAGWVCEDVVAALGATVT